MYWYWYYNYYKKNQEKYEGRIERLEKRKLISKYK